MTSNRVCDELKIVLADTYALYLKTQNFHWNVTGPSFYSLHLLFEKHYKELAQAADDIAERIRALGGRAPGGFEEFLALKTLTEAKGEKEAMAMIQSLCQSHELICQRLHAVLNEARKVEDEVTEDLILDRLDAHEKTKWMLKSHLG